MNAALITDAVLLPIDTPTANGRVYPREVVEKAMKDLQIRLKLNRNAVLGELAPLTDPNYCDVRLENVAVRYSNFRIEGNELVADAQPYGPHGRLYSQLLEEQVPIHVAMRSFVKVGEDNVVTEITKVVSFDITNGATVTCPAS